ncbi:O-antigen ligase family protein [Patescibacteria group bacterium]|nr:O-antigen ligase family protein [Patescibacteria group bacterium]
MQDNLQSKFYWVYLIGFFLIVSLPFWAIPPLLHPPAWGKTIVLRIILSCLFFFFIYQVLYNKNTFVFEKLKSKPVKIILGILITLLVLFLLATIFSQDAYFSFWGNPYRAGGFLNFAFYITFAIFVFLILKPRHWKLLWNFSLGIALLISLIALLQQFNAFKEFLVSYSARLPATLGSAIFLAIYLSFFVFLSLSFAILEKNRKKKILYLLSFLIIVFVIFLSGTRAVFLGIALAFLYFILFYPVRKLPPQTSSPQNYEQVPQNSNGTKQARGIKILKIITLALLVIGISGIYYLNTPSEKISSHPLVVKNQALTTIVSRIKIKPSLEDPRFAYWKMTLPAIKEKPLLGYGPENFSIAFDKYYDPSLPYMGYEVAKGWTDKAHGFIFETAITAGIPALIVYLSLFAVLLWQLQKLKNPHKSEEISINQRPIIIHSVQATIIAYFISIFLGFNTFDTYLIFFLLVGYCLYLIFSSKKEILLNQNENKPTISLLYKWRKTIIIFLFIFLLLFIWLYNLKPLLINKELNWAEYYSTTGKCQQAIDKMEKVLPSHSIINHYVLLQYSEVLKECQILNPEEETKFIQKSIQVLEEAAKLRPTYTRTWLLLGSYSNFAVENNPNLKSEEKNELLLKADSYFTKASELSPKRKQIFLGWSDTFILLKRYNEAKEKANQCIELNDKIAECYWQKAFTNIVLGELDQSKENIKKAKEKGFPVTFEDSFSKLLNIYLIAIKDSKKINLELYKDLVDIYQNLISFNPTNFQYRASLAYTFRTLGEYEKARKEALKVIELSPESKANVEEFLRTLPY